MSLVFELFDEQHLKKVVLLKLILLIAGFIQITYYITLNKNIYKIRIPLISVFLPITFLIALLMPLCFTQQQISYFMTTQMSHNIYSKLFYF